MKKILLISITFLSFISFSYEKREISLPDYWQVVSVVKDTSIQKGQSKIKIIVNDKSNLQALTNVKVFINTNLLIGLTDTDGIINASFPFGENKFCADTQEGNSFTANYNFLNQHYYVVKVVMDKYKIVEYFDGGKFQIADKPVIYLYPAKKQNINVKVTPKNDFLFTYPQYPNNGWNVVGHPSGKIDYNNKTYNYLFWEGMYPPIIEKGEKTAFIVNSDTLISFLENTLTTIGLTNEEQTDFITFWGPRLMENQLNFIHFYFNDDFEKYIAKLEVSPTPKTLIRVFMTYHSVENIENITPQIIPSYKREGFTVVEWGGSYK